MSPVSQGTSEGSIPVICSTPVVKIQTHYVGGLSSNSYFGSAGMALRSASSTPNSVFQEVCLFVISSHCLCSTALNTTKHPLVQQLKTQRFRTHQAITRAFKPCYNPYLITYIRCKYQENTFSQSSRLLVGS